MASPPPGPRVVLLALEFLGPVFSGNGQYGRCVARALASAGVTLLVVSGRPAAAPLAAQDAALLDLLRAPHALVDVPLPAWGTLDRRCAWRAFAAAAARDARVHEATRVFAPHAALCVDFHTPRAWAALAHALGAPAPPMIWLNFRVFTTSTALHAPAPASGGDACGCAECAARGSAGGAAGDAAAAGDDGASCALSDTAFYEAEEAAAVGAADLTVALCRTDALQLTALALGRSAARGGAAAPGARESFSRAAHARGGGVAAATPPRVAILLPPLRSDVEALARRGGAVADLPAPDGLRPGHALVTSLVRLSPEKHALAAAQLLAATRAALDAARLQPLVLGAPGADAEYVIQTRAAVAAVGDAAIVPAGLFGPAALAGALAAGALNLHPCLADAYGMTIVEAAAMGVPSLVHVPACCGANAAAAAIAEFEPLPDGLNNAFAGASRVHVRAAADDAQLAGALLDAAAALPPVGACDLLAPTPRDAASAPGIIPWDWTAPLDDSLIEAAASVFREAAAVKRGDAGAAGSAVGAVASAARTRALAWSEAAHGRALRALVEGVIANHAAR
jgi:hypothetical protein